MSQQTIFDLRAFSELNIKRCEAPDGFNHPLHSWHASQWTNALAGEAGEACNLTKKLLRHDGNTGGNIKPEDMDRETVRLRALKELADVIIYADLAIRWLGGETADVLRQTFNNKSHDIGCGYIYVERTQ